MLTTLLESNAARSRRVGGTLASTVVHAAVIAGAIAITVKPGRAKDIEPWVKPPVFVALPHRLDVPPEQNSSRHVDLAASQPDHFPTIEFIDPKIPNERVPDVVVPGPTPEEFGPRVAVGNEPRGSIGFGDPSSVVEERLVDRAPRLIGRVEPPIFPTALRLSGRSGRVVVQFVVDTLGRAESGDVKFVESSDPLFSDAVRAALPRYRFSPGEAGGRKVRTLVQLPFDFSLVR